MRRIFTMILCAIVGSSAAAESDQNLSIGIGLSSFGGNVEIASRRNARFGLRAAYWGGVNLNYAESDAQSDISGDFELGGFAAIGDYYPTAGRLRLSGGVFVSDSELNAAGTETVSGTAQAITTQASFKNQISPLVAVGYEFDLGSQWRLAAELGVIYTGGIETMFTADDPTVQNDVDNDPDLQEISNDLESFTVYPQLGLTLSYRF